MIYVDQSADALSFSLIKGHADKGQFSVLKEASLGEGNMKVVAGIIGSSHYILYSIGDTRFTEVLACIQVDTGSPCLSIARLDAWREEGVRVGMLIEEVGYEIDIRLGEWEESYELARKIEMLACHNHDNSMGLVVEFPGTEDSEGPKTIVWVEICGGGNMIETRTVHEYPNEGRIVFTDARIKI